MSADLIVYGLVAAGLVVWLRSILGTRHGDERQRHNPYVSGPDQAADIALEGMASYEEIRESAEDKIIALVEKPAGPLSIEKQAQAGLVAIARADASFDIKSFLTAAQDAFAIIVESFGEGDRETLKNLLADPVYKAFESAITQREGRGETLVTEIHTIKKAEIIEARLDARSKTAYVTIRFTAGETSVGRDKDGNIISGHPDKVTQMRDVWVFGRKLRSRDPRWLVHETRGDFEDDNEILPDTGA